MSYANVVATLALFFALSGGAAYAASHYLITSTKQISPKVLKSLKGATGAAGKNGANGSNGAAGTGTPGPQGNPGTPGVNGSNGTNGTPGTSVTNTKLEKGNGTCPEGGAEFKVGTGAGTHACNGSTGFTETLPSGKTETGTWGFIFPESEAEEENYVSLSFPLPLEADLAKANTLYVNLEQQKHENGTEPPEQCTGTAEVPTAAAGYLCMYEGYFSPSSRQPTVAQIYRPGTSGEAGEGAGTAGALAFVEYPAGSPDKKGTIAGSWAVTAP